MVGLIGWFGVATVILIQRTHHGSSTVSDQSQAAPYLGMLVNQDLQVLDVDWSGSAARAGVQRGDVLRKFGSMDLPATVSIDSRQAGLPVAVPASVRSSNDVKRVFSAAVPKWNRTLTVVVERNGKMLTLPILVSGVPFSYDAAHPQPSVTPVPSSLDATTFYL
jgi:hypothetical protein